MNNAKSILPKRTIYLDILRILATLTVIFYHQKGVVVNPDISWSEDFYSVCAGITRWCVPVFVMISGSLFLDNDRPLTLKKLYSKNILRLVTAFAFWSAVYAVYNYSSVVSFFEDFIMGRYHLWFLYMIVGLYIITPLLRKITAHKETTEYFLILGAIFGISTFTFNMTPLAKIAPTVSNYVFDNMGLSAFAGYAFFFVAGYYLHKYTLPKVITCSLIVSGVVGCIITILLTIISSHNSDAPYYYSHFFLPTTLECIGVFLFGKVVLSNINFSTKAENVIYKLSKYSFGAYLVHDFILILVRPYVIDCLGGSPVLAIIVATAVTTVISFGISLIVNKIPVLNKYIV